MVKAVIFDLDDTLISERQYIDSGYHYIAKLLSNRLNKNEEELYKLLNELLIESPKNVFNRLFDKLEFCYTNDDILKLVEEYRNHVPAIKFYDDVLPCLEFLKSKGIKVGIITDGYLNTQRRKLNAIKAYNYFDEIIITDEFGREFWKPHPKAFEIMQERLNVEFNEMIYVGDNPEKDFYIGSILPIKTVRIIRKQSIYINTSYYMNIKEHFTIYSLTDLKIK
ncbi:HAD family hydrolase, partial [Thermoanaerobacterium thermosaccharolyticum]|uniref:HAD family hydrolase n=2 Tax=Thermoanaerobacterium thermosaccharolyticum TaxID=1517 RepID=UPI0017801E2E